MSTAFVLSGGAALGAVQVGMLQALHESGVRPDLVVGTSVGAVNAAWVAGDPGGVRLDELAMLWRSLRRGQVFPAGPAALAGLLGRRAGLIDQRPLRQFLTKHIPIDKIEDAELPLHIIATDVLSGNEVRLSAGSTVDAVMASAAIPGVFAPVEIGGRIYMDGGVVNNSAICHAVALGATMVYVLPTGASCSLERPPTNALGMALHGLALLVNRRLVDDVEHYRTRVDVRVVPPPCRIRVGPADFTHAGELIEAGRATAAIWLEDQRDVGIGILRPHSHVMN